MPASPSVGVHLERYTVRVRGRVYEYLRFRARGYLSRRRVVHLGRFRNYPEAAAAAARWRKEHGVVARPKWNKGRLGPLKTAILELLADGRRRPLTAVWAALPQQISTTYRAVRRALTALHASDLIENEYDHRGYTLAQPAGQAFSAAS